MIALGVASFAFLGCTRSRVRSLNCVRSASVGGDNPFGGAPAVDVPSDARAMSAFLKAEVAMNDGDREEALKDYAEAVQYDPSNAALKVRLATLYVRDGRLKEALEQVNQALAINPNSARRAVARRGYQLGARRRHHRGKRLSRGAAAQSQEPGSISLSRHALRQARRLCRGGEDLRAANRARSRIRSLATTTPAK